ncbi:H-NS histone family protein [Sinimarinibacterium sp. CAU 1509]|uniref:H-NS histone family protein n=1 Tax=Sinimarinibacterium sp. CAU 1509 TaxID=2562283 RepID=UPI0010AD4FA1|nr:H-NS histone family protein [Sinimarinibacterium sp. CAU 1509]TJY61963.1 H-NS histone family protein [Sinimarinibacterium sp. CAU 1509]
MPTYNELISQIESLKKQAEAQRKAELAEVIQDIKQKMAEYGIKISDLSGKAPGKRSTVAAKYRNEATGETWTGRGKPPKWLAEAEAKGTPRTQFLIKG